MEEQRKDKLKSPSNWGQTPPRRSTGGRGIYSSLPSSISPLLEDFSPRSSCHDGKLAPQMCPLLLRHSPPLLFSPALHQIYTNNRHIFALPSEPRSARQTPYDFNFTRGERYSESESSIKEVGWWGGDSVQQVCVQSESERSGIHSEQIACWQIVCL